MPLNKYACYTVHICPTAYLTVLNISVGTQQNVTLIYHAIAIYIWQQQICPSNAKCIPNYSLCIHGGSMPLYMPYMNLLPSVMQPESLNTSNNNDNTNDDAGQQQPLGQISQKPVVSCLM